MYFPKADIMRNYNLIFWQEFSHKWSLALKTRKQMKGSHPQVKKIFKSFDRCLLVFM